MTHAFAASDAELTYQPLSKCAPTLDDFAEYQNQLKASASSDDLNKELTKISEDIRDDENKFSDRKLNDAKRYLGLVRIGQKYLQKSTLMRDQKTAGNLRLTRCTKSSMPAVQDASTNNKELKNALNLFRKAVADFPTLPATDGAMYGLIVGQVRSNSDMAAQYYQIFLRQYPNSKWLPAVHLSLGEYAFHHHDYANAYEYYRQAIATQDPVAMPFAYYKLAWLRFMQATSRSPNLPEKKNQSYNAENNSEYNTELQQTIEELKIVINVIGKLPARTSRFDLKKEAIQDLALIWAEQNDFDAPANYFKSIGAKSAIKLNLNRLASRLAAHRDFGGSATALMKLLGEVPLQSDNPEIFEKTLNLLYYAKDTSKLVEAIRAMVVNLHGNSPWRQINSENQDRLRFADIVVERSLRTYGLALERDGTATADPVQLSAATEILGLYLAQFPNQNAAYDVRFAYANVLAKLGNHAQAVQQYLKTAKSKPSDGTHLKDSWLRATAEQELVISTNPPKPPTLTEPPTPQELPKEISLLIEIIATAPIFTPHEVAQASARLRAAELLRSYGNVEAAENAYATLAREFPETTPGQQAIQRILVYHVTRSSWSDVLQWCETFERKAPNLGNPIAGVVGRSLQQALLGLASQEAVRSNFPEAAKYYLSFVDRFPSDMRAESALYNASVAFFRAGLLAKGIQANLRLVKNYPKSRYLADSLANLATAYSESLNFTESARHNMQLATNFPSDTRAADALFDAGMIQGCFGNHEEAAFTFARFSQSYPKDSRVGLALIENSVQKTATKSKDDLYRIELDRSVSDDLLHPRYYDLTRDDGGNQLERIQSKRRLWDTLASFQSNPLFQRRSDDNSANHELAAKLFQLAYHESKPILASRAGTESRYEGDPKLKAQRVEQLTRQLDQVMKIDDTEFTLAAHLVIAALNESLAATLFAVPDHGNEAATWERRALATQALAQHHYEIAAQKAQTEKNQSLWAALALQRLGASGFGHYDQVNEAFASPYFMTQPGQAGGKSTGASGTGYIYSMSKFPRPAHLVELAGHDIYQAKETLANLPHDSSTRLMRARAYILLGRIKEAEQDARAVITQEPKNQEARKILAKVSLARGRPDQVDVILSNFVPRGPSDSDAYNILAMSALMRDEVTLARDLFNSAIQLNPSDTAAYLNKGILSLQFHDLKSARAAFAKAHELMPEDPNAALHLAVTESMRGNHKNAAKLLDEAQTHHGDPELVHFNLAVTDFKRGEYGEALEQVDIYASVVRSSPAKLRLAENLRNALEAATAMPEMKNTSTR
jgi:tetratricopeptide (TPR) repeat protein